MPPLRRNTLLSTTPSGLVPTPPSPFCVDYLRLDGTIIYDLALWEARFDQASVEQPSDAPSLHRVLNSYIGYSAAGLSIAGGYTANAGLNVWRYGTESLDLGVGVRVDTGMALSDVTTRGYLLGFGGEIGYGEDGSVRSVGLSLGLMKLHMRYLHALLILIVEEEDHLWSRVPFDFVLKRLI